MKWYTINFTEKEIEDYWDTPYPLNIRAIVKQDREIVRCADCKHRKDKATGYECRIMNANGLNYTKDNDYCSYGERSTE